MQMTIWGLFKKSGKHLLALISDVLDLSKIEADQLTIESIACSPQQIISKAVFVLRVGATDKGIGLDYRWEGPVPKSIHTDPYRLKQSLLTWWETPLNLPIRGVLIVARVDRSAACYDILGLLYRVLHLVPMTSARAKPRRTNIQRE
jgi:hypothetical protein